MKKILQKAAAISLSFIFLMSGALVTFHPALAAATEYSTCPGSTDTSAIPNPLGCISTLCQLVNILINVVTEIGAIVAVLFIIWSGFLFIRAQGNPAEITKAKNTLYNVLLGTAILLGASVIARVIFNTVTAILKPTVGASAC